jgi:hypothetical protein
VPCNKLELGAEAVLRAKKAEAEGQVY